MDKREKIRELIASLNSLSYDDDHSLDAYLARAKNIILELFGEYNAYLTCLSYIRFHPISPHASIEENVRFWARAKKEMRDFLYVMLDDPILAPQDQDPGKIMAVAGDAARASSPMANSDLSEVVQTFKHKVRVDLGPPRGDNPVALRPETFRIDGPHPVEKVRVDLRDLFALEPRMGGVDPRRSFFHLAEAGLDGLLFLPSPDATASNDVLSYLRHMGMPVTEGEPLTPAGASVQEQILRYSKVTTAIIMLNDDHFAYPRTLVDNHRYLGPASSVCFSLGFLVGKLGRKRVIAIYPDEEDFKRPTNYFDSVYIAYDRAGSWKKELAAYFRELWLSLDEAPVRHPVSS